MVKHTYNLDCSVATTTGVDIGIGGTAVYVQGEDVILEFTVYETTDHSTTVDISASGLTAEWVLTDGAGAEAFSKTISGGGITITDAANGVLQVTIAQSDTSGLTAETVSHQLTITDDGSGNQSVLATGDFQITESKT